MGGPGGTLVSNPTGGFLVAAPLCLSPPYQGRIEKSPVILMASGCIIVKHGIIVGTTPSVINRAVQYTVQNSPI